MKASPRKWQSQCIEIALEHYTTMPHFFCQATPGAGKTRMAAELARHLLEQGKIDLVLCFALFRSVLPSRRRLSLDILRCTWEASGWAYRCRRSRENLSSDGTPGRSLLEAFR
jgi:DNA polymerase III delta prime subunit